MRFFGLIIIIVMGSVACRPPQLTGMPDRIKPNTGRCDRPQITHFGNNLGRFADWSGSVYVANAVRQSRPWILQQKGGTNPWTVAEPMVPLRADGYPSSMPANRGVLTMMMGKTAGTYPAGSYTFCKKGQGQVDLFGDVSARNLQHGQQVSINPSNTGVWLKIQSTEPSDPVRDLGLMLPGYSCDYPHFFRDELVTELSGTGRGVRARMGILRFMDFNHTNQNTNITWSDRTDPQYFTQAPQVAYEHMIELANRTCADAWINVPHQANDSYVANLALLIRTRLDPNLKVYIEYSNEVWNFAAGFAASQYINTVLGPARYPGISAAQAFRQAWSDEVKRVFTIFTREFAGELHRLERVLGSQAANSWVTDKLLQWNGLGSLTDVSAIAPYFCGATSLTSAAALAQYCEDEIVTNMRPRVTAHRQLADQYGLRLVTYEAGQHLIPTPGLVPSNWQALAQFNQSQEMADLYETGQVAGRRTVGYFNELKLAGIETIVHYTYVDAYGPFGSWGQRPYLDGPSTPKSRAIDRWALR